MILKSIVFSAALVAGALHAACKSDSGTKTPFLQAKAALERMLESRAPSSYEQAIYVIENAYWNETINEQAFKAAIDQHVANVGKIIAAQKPMPGYQPKDVLDLAQANQAKRRQNYRNAVINGAIFQYMTDTTIVISAGQCSYHLPYCYSANDPLGSSDWANTQVSHLLDRRSGNCFALASLYKIFSERLHSNAWLCTAPGHIYIRHADEKGTLYNVELAGGGSFPGTGTLGTLTYSTPEAVRNNIALRDLDSKQSIALCLVYLAKGYQHKLGVRPDGFMLDCAETALRYDSLCLNAMLLKSEVLAERVNEKGSVISRLAGDSDFLAYQALLAKLYDLGYREMPHQMKNMLVKGWTKDSLTLLISGHYAPKNTVKGGVAATRYASLSWGVFDEEMRTKPIESYARALFDTRTKKIVGFQAVPAIYNGYDFDPVAFAWNVDPLAHKFPGQSPYSAMNNNPILYVDPDGQAGIIYLIPLANSGISGKEMLQIVNTANVALQAMNLTTRVKLFPGNPADFKTYNLDKTDAIAVLGQKMDLINYTSGFNTGMANNMKDQLGGDSPENSEKGGYFIGLDVGTVRSWGRQMNSDFSTSAAFAILHGAGHNADNGGLDHIETLSASLRWSGNHVGSAITGALTITGNTLDGWSKEDGVNSLGDLMNNKPLRGYDRNSTYIGLMQKRFGTSPAKDNYSRNSNAWQYLKKLYKTEPKQGLRL